MNNFEGRNEKPEKLGIATALLRCFFVSWICRNKKPEKLGIATLKRLIFPSENAPSRNEKPKIPGIATD